MKNYPALFYDLDESKLDKWLSDFTETEGWDYDFKLGLPYKNDKQNKLHLVATFCAFSNTSGGFLIYGIDDDRKVVGLSPDKNFKKKINDLVGKYIKPPLQNRWDIIKQFELIIKNPGKYIYIVHIPESLIYHKPHVCTYQDDKRIYIRQSTSNLALDDGRDIRSFFFDKRFSPYCFETMDKIFADIKNIRYQADYIDTLFFLELKQYLEERVKMGKEFVGLTRLLDAIITRMKIIKDEISKKQSINSPIEILVDEDSNGVETNKQELDVLVDQFQDLYKKLHGVKT